MVAYAYQSCITVASNTFPIATEMDRFTRRRCCVQILSWPLKTTQQFHRPPVSTHSGPGYNFTSSYSTANSASLATQPRERLASQLAGKQRCAPAVKGGQTGGKIRLLMDKSNPNGSAYRKDPVEQFLIVINTIARIVASGQ